MVSAPTAVTRAAFSQRCERPVEALQYFAASPLLLEPGTQYRYSSYGWIIVSAAVEATTAEPFLEFMRERIFDPLEMRDTRADSAMNPIPDRVTFYFPRFASDPTYGLHLVRDLDYSCYAGASAFLSTPSDLVRFGMAVNSGKLLRRDTMHCSTPHSDWPRARDGLRSWLGPRDRHAGG